MKLNKEIETRFDKKFLDRFKGHISWVEGKDLPNDIKAFLSEELDNQKKEMIERIEKMTKNSSVIKQSEVALKYRNGKYSLRDINRIVIGYNKALDDIIKAIK